MYPFKCADSDSNATRYIHMSKAACLSEKVFVYSRNSLTPARSYTVQDVSCLQDNLVNKIKAAGAIDTDSGVGL